MIGLWRSALASGLIVVAVPPAAIGSAPPEPMPEEIFAGEEDLEAAVPAAPPTILSERDAARIRAPKGITLQWITWDTRGPVSTTVDEQGIWRLYGEQTGPDGAGLVVDGTITEIGADYFVLEGAVTIVNTPNEGRTCEGYGPWRFEVTQNRKYYRLRQFEWCDDLTDYIDIYF